MLPLNARSRALKTPPRRAAPVIHSPRLILFQSKARVGGRGRPPRRSRTKYQVVCKFSLNRKYLIVVSLPRMTSQSTELSLAAFVSTFPIVGAMPHFCPNGAIGAAAAAEAVCIQSFSKHSSKSRSQQARPHFLFACLVCLSVCLSIHRTVNNQILSVQVTMCHAVRPSARPQSPVALSFSRSSKKNMMLSYCCKKKQVPRVGICMHTKGGGDILLLKCKWKITIYTNCFVIART